MRKLIYLVAVATLAWSCTQQAGSGVSAETQTAVNEPSVNEQVAQRVQEIYDDVFGLYNQMDSLRNQDKPDMQDANERQQALCANYCSQEWNSLVHEIDQIDSLYHQGELGFWEADYWIMGQDWHNLLISDIQVLASTSDEAAVQFNLHNLDTVQPVAVMLVNEDGVWKIDNFQAVDSDLDLKKAMKRYVTEQRQQSDK